MEQSESQAKGIESDRKEVCFVKKSGTQKPFKKVQNNFKKRSNECMQCGGEWPHKGECKAKGQQCHNCGKMNHFSRKCLAKNKGNKRVQKTEKVRQRIHQVKSQVDTQGDASLAEAGSGSESEGSDYVFTVKGEKSKKPICKVKINNQSVEMLIDTGSSVNVLDKNTFERVLPGAKLESVKTELFGYGCDTQALPAIGKVMVDIETQNRIMPVLFFVVRYASSGCILGCDAALELNLVRFVNQINTNKLIEQYPEVFSEKVGTLKDFEFDIHVDESVCPVAQPAHRVPFHIRKLVGKELDRLEQDNIIEKASGPTPRVSGLVVVPKKNKDQIRVCVDLRCVNKAVIRERHPMPTVEEVINQLNGAAVFSKLDLREGYHQLILKERSRH